MENNDMEQFGKRLSLLSGILFGAACIGLILGIAEYFLNK
jgi:hypothetical protein